MWDIARIVGDHADRPYIAASMMPDNADKAAHAAYPRRAR